MVEVDCFANFDVMSVSYRINSGFDKLFFSQI